MLSQMAKAYLVGVATLLLLVAVDELVASPIPMGNKSHDTRLGSGSGLVVEQLFTDAQQVDDLASPEFSASKDELVGPEVLLHWEELQALAAKSVAAPVQSSTQPVQATSVPAAKESGVLRFIVYMAFALIIGVVALMLAVGLITMWRMPRGDSDRAR